MLNSKDKPSMLLHTASQFWYVCFQSMSGLLQHANSQLETFWTLQVRDVILDDKMISNIVTNCLNGTKIEIYYNRTSLFNYCALPIFLSCTKCHFSLFIALRWVFYGISTNRHVNRFRIFVSQMTTGHLSLVVVIIRSFPHFWRITMFVAR